MWKFLQLCGQNVALVVSIVIVTVALMFIDGLWGAMWRFSDSGTTSPSALWPLVRVIVMAVEVMISIFMVYLALLMAKKALPQKEDLSKLSPDDLKDRRHRRHVVAWVFIGAVSSVVFAVVTVGVELLAYQVKWIPPEHMDRIAYSIWGFVCLIEVMLQIIPMIVRYQTKSWDLVADQWTSYAPLMGCVVVFTLMIFAGLQVGGPGLIILALSFCVSLVELELLALSNPLIAAARGTES